METKKEARSRRAKQTRIRIAQQRATRLVVLRSNSHIYAQIIAPTGDKVLASASTLEADVRKDVKNGGNKAAATLVGTLGSPFGNGPLLTAAVANPENRFGRVDEQRVTFWGSLGWFLVTTGGGIGLLSFAPLSQRLGRRVEMTNLIGEEVNEAARWMTVPGASVHLYGKGEARARRKMGHVTRVWPAK